MNLGRFHLGQGRDLLSRIFGDDRSHPAAGSSESHLHVDIIPTRWRFFRGEIVYQAEIDDVHEEGEVSPERLGPVPQHVVSDAIAAHASDYIAGSDVGLVIEDGDGIAGIAYCVGSIDIKPLRATTDEDFIQAYRLNVLGAVNAPSTIRPTPQHTTTPPTRRSSPSRFVPRSEKAPTERSLNAISGLPILAALDSSVIFFFPFGLDLAQWQLRIASGERLTLSQDALAPRGWAIECRITSEDAANGFLPDPEEIAAHAARAREAHAQVQRYTWSAAGPDQTAEAGSDAGHEGAVPGHRALAEPALDQLLERARDLPLRHGRHMHELHARRHQPLQGLVAAVRLRGDGELTNDQPLLEQRPDLAASRAGVDPAGEGCLRWRV